MTPGDRPGIAGWCTRAWPRCRIAVRSLSLVAPPAGEKCPKVCPDVEPELGRVRRSSDLVTELTRSRADARHPTHAACGPTRGAVSGSTRGAPSELPPVLIRLQRDAGNRAVVELLSGVAPARLPRATGPSRAAGPTTAAGRALQREVHPESLTGEMQGTRFTVSADIAAGLGPALKEGETVEVTVWDNASDQAVVRRLPPHPPAVQFDVPKKLLRPVASGVAGIIPYSADLGNVTGDFERGEQKLEAETTRKEGARPDEVARLEGLQKKRLKLLNRRLIQGSFLNRFDADIKQWVDFYNAKFKFTGKDALDPNLVKAMLFQETQMGTSGEHLEDLTETDPKIKTRQNILQNVDSGAEALLELIPEEEPAIAAKHGLDAVRKDLAKVTDTETFLWNDKRFTDAVMEFWAAVPVGSLERNVDYGFWIKSGVRWLFHKRQSRKIKSWEEAARAYNGSGAKARKYKREVLARLKKAQTAQAAGKEFVAGKL
jgi:hypothetical protein